MEEVRYLIHKKLPVAKIVFKDLMPVRISEIMEAEHMPVGTNDTVDSIKRWLAGRLIPEERANLHLVLKQINTQSPISFAGFGHISALTDGYWFSSTEELQEQITWEMVSPWYHNWTKSGQAFFAGYMDYVNDINSPDFVTPGIAPKTWAVENDGIFLLKEDIRNKQAAFSHIAAAQTAELLGFRHVPYFFSVTEGRLCIGCPCILSDDNAEMVGLWQLFDESTSFDDMCAFMDSFGLTEAFSKMLLLDYLAGFSGRTLQDMSIIRDTETLKVYGLAPYYGCSTGYFQYQDTSLFTGNKMEEDMKWALSNLSVPRLNKEAVRKMLLRVASELKLDSADSVIDAALERVEKTNRLSS